MFLPVYIFKIWGTGTLLGNKKTKKLIRKGFYAPMPRGQELAFTRMCDDFTKAGKMAVLILAEHYVDDCEKDVDVAMCIVRKYYFKFKWYDNFNGTVKNLTDRFIQSVNKNR